MTNSANWSRSTLFAKAGYIWVQQDKGKIGGFKFSDKYGKESDVPKFKVKMVLMQLF